MRVHDEERKGIQSGAVRLGELERRYGLIRLQHPALPGPVESEWRERASQFTGRWSPPCPAGSAGRQSQEKEANMTMYHAVVIGLLLLIPWSLVGVNLVGAGVAAVGRRLADRHRG